MSQQSWQETLISSQADGTALTAAAAASAIPAAAKYTLPANFFKNLGQQLLIKASGRISLNATPGTARFDVRFGATVVFDGLAMVMDTAGYTNVGWYLEILLTLRVLGASANLMGQGTFVSACLAGQPATPPKGALTAILPWNSAPAVGSNFDTTATQQIDFFFTQTASTGSMTVHQYAVWSLN